MGKCKVHGRNHHDDDDSTANDFKRGTQYLQWLERAGVEIEVQAGPYFTASVVMVLNALERHAPCKSSAKGVRGLIGQMLAPWDAVNINGVCLGTTIRETVEAAYTETDGGLTVPIPEIIIANVPDPEVITVQGSPFARTAPAQTSN